MEYQYEKPATGILKQADFGDSIFYAIPCSCGNDEDEMHMEVEIDEYQEIVVNTYVTTKTDWWRRLVKEYHEPMIENSWLYSIDYKIRSIINGLYHRINITYQLWTNGYVKYQHTIIMNKQQSINYAYTILNAIKQMDDNLSAKQQ